MKSPYRWEPVNQAILPPSKDPRGGWRYWHFNSGLPDAIDIIQVSQKYMVSLGAHAIHGNLLFRRGKSFDYFEVQSLADTLAFIFDTPVLPVAPNQVQEFGAAVRGVSGILENLGFHPRNPTELIEYLTEARLQAGHQNDCFLRLFPEPPLRKAKKERHVFAYDLPNNPRLTDALYVYHLGISAAESSSQILHFWRVLEALTAAKSPQRVQCLRWGIRERLAPVWGAEIRGSGEVFHRNLVTVYRAIARPSYVSLLRQHGTDEEVIKFLFKKRRCPSAHAEAGDPLRASSTTPLANILRDMYLIRLCARAAIQAAWIGIM